MNFKYKPNWLCDLLLINVAIPESIGGTMEWRASSDLNWQRLCLFIYHQYT